MPILTPAIFETKAMRDALAIPLPGNWPDDRKVTGAEQAKAIATVLIPSLHKHLVNVSIGYLFVEQMGKNDRDVLAKAKKTAGALEFYSTHAFLVVVNWTAWKSLDAHARVALIDHELCHFGHEDTDKGTKYVMVSHDVEEFTSIVQRWGTWRPDLRRLAMVMSQRDLFEQPTAETAN
jgi:hypothetical protein